MTISNQEEEFTRAITTAVAVELEEGVYAIQTTGFGVSGVSFTVHRGDDGTQRMLCCGCHSGKPVHKTAAAALSWVEKLLDAGVVVDVHWVVPCDGCGRPVVTFGDDAAQAALELLVLAPDGVS